MQRLSDEYRKSLDSMTAIYQAKMTDQSMAYLASRGIGPEAVAAYRLGTVNASVAEYQQYSGMISIPYLTTLGGVVALKFRQAHNCTKECTHPKYLTPHPTRLYNTRAFDVAEQYDYIAVTEGELDAITLDYCAGIPAVGVPGVRVWQQHSKVWRLLFMGFSRVFIFADNDDPGLQLAKEILQDVDTSRIVELPSKDVNQTYLDYGAEALKELADV